MENELKYEMIGIKAVVETDISLTNNFIQITENLAEKQPSIYFDGLLFGLQECLRLLDDLKDRINNILEESGKE